MRSLSSHFDEISRLFYPDPSQIVYIGTFQSAALSLSRIHYFPKNKRAIISFPDSCVTAYRISTTLTITKTTADITHVARERFIDAPISSSNRSHESAMYPDFAIHAYSQKNYSLTLSNNAFTRSSIGGCVINSALRRLPRNGFAIKRDAVGFVATRAVCGYALIFCRADARP